jgi:hypothetical protein
MDERIPRPKATGYAAGQVVDDASGRPIAGALVVISPNVYSGSFLPHTNRAKREPQATTDASGKFTVTRLLQSEVPTWSWKYAVPSATPVPNPEWIEVFLPAKDGHATYHGFETINYERANNLGIISLTTPTTDEIAWKRRIERDRAHLSVPAVRTPLVFDSITLLAARRWAAYMAANDWYNHPCPPPNAGYAPCVLTWQWEIEHHGMPSAENIAYANPDWASAEAAFMSERFNCPRRNWKKCPWSETTGHYINISAASNWIGLGIAVGTNAANKGNAYYDQEFTAPLNPGFPEAVRHYIDFARTHADWK